MEIGNKLKNARLQSNLTQEQAAEALGVSRQTISNWENNKTYPDIISVIKMSDLYSISLDKLLKEENTTSDYLEYLEESTNVVKSKNKLSKVIQIGAYLVIWAISVLIFWVVMDSGDEMAYVLLVLYLVLPLSEFIISILIGKDSEWGKHRWLMSLFFGVMYLLAGYATFDLANTVSFHNLNMPDFTMLIPGIAVSLVGIAIGALIKMISSKLKNRKQKSNE